MKYILGLSLHITLSHPSSAQSLLLANMDLSYCHVYVCLWPTEFNEGYRKERRVEMICWGIDSGHSCSAEENDAQSGFLLAPHISWLQAHLLVLVEASIHSVFFPFLHLYQNETTWCSRLAVRLLWKPPQCIIYVMSSVANTCHTLNFIFSDKKSWRCLCCMDTRNLVLRWIPCYLQVSKDNFMSWWKYLCFLFLWPVPQNYSLLGYCVHPWCIWILTSLILTNDDPWSLVAPLCMYPDPTW